jgi:NAD(P)-dependent dehydrogenase (short-subunit alcohol dehydrogenase family)
VKAFGRIDILVNNAGRGILGTVVTTAEEDWDDIMAVNLKGVFLCSKHAVPVMKASGGGAIVNVASTVSVVGIPDRAAYVASKGGVAALTRAMALDHVADNIRVNSVGPGVIWSNYYDKMMQEVPDPAAFKKGLEDRAPMGRVGEPKDVAAAILYLASDESGFVTGSMMTMDGGYTAR